MTISWQWMVIVIVLVVACVVAAVLGEDVIAGTLGGFAGGLLTKGGALGRKSAAPAAVAIVLALLSAGCGGASASYAAVSGACEAAEAAVEAACDPGEDTVCRGEMTNAAADMEIDCIRAGCNRALDAIEADQ